MSSDYELATESHGRLNLARQAAKYTNAVSVGVGIVIIIFHLGFFLGGSDGLMDNIMSYGWWTIAVLGLAAASGYACHRLGAPFWRAEATGEDQEVAEIAAEIFDAEHSRTATFELVRMWVQEEHFQGSWQLMVYIWFQPPLASDRGADPYHGLFPFSGVEWIPVNRDGRDVAFPSRSRNHLGHRLQILSREYPPELPSPAGS